jgi:hypothetical protein
VRAGRPATAVEVLVDVVVMPVTVAVSVIARMVVFVAVDRPVGMPVLVGMVVRVILMTVAVPVAMRVGMVVRMAVHRPVGVPVLVRVRALDPCLALAAAAGRAHRALPFLQTISMSRTLSSSPAVTWSW